MSKRILRHDQRTLLLDLVLHLRSQVHQLDGADRAALPDEARRGAEVALVGRRTRGHVRGRVVVRLHQLHSEQPENLTRGNTTVDAIGVVVTVHGARAGGEKLVVHVGRARDETVRRRNVLLIERLCSVGASGDERIRIGLRRAGNDLRSTVATRHRRRCTRGERNDLGQVVIERAREGFAALLAVLTAELEVALGLIDGRDEHGRDQEIVNRDDALVARDLLADDVRARRVVRRSSLPGRWKLRALALRDATNHRLRLEDIEFAEGREDFACKHLEEQRVNRARVIRLTREGNGLIRCSHDNNPREKIWSWYETASLRSLLPFALIVRRSGSRYFAFVMR